MFSFRRPPVSGSVQFSGQARSTQFGQRRLVDIRSWAFGQPAVSTFFSARSLSGSAFLALFLFDFSLFLMI